MWIFTILLIPLTISLITDIKERKILNIVTFPTILFGLAYNTITQGWHGLLFSSLGLLVGFGLLLIPFFLGGMGAGDVKLMGAIGAVMGMSFTLRAFVAIAITGGIISLIIIIKQKGLLQLMKSFFFMVILLQFKQSKILLDSTNKTKIMFPYGVPIVLGTIFALIWGVQ